MVPFAPATVKMFVSLANWRKHPRDGDGQERNELFMIIYICYHSIKAKFFTL